MRAKVGGERACHVSSQRPPADVQLQAKGRKALADSQADSAHAPDDPCSGPVLCQRRPADFPRLTAVGGEVDSDDLIAATEVPIVLGLPQSSSVTTSMRHYPGFLHPSGDLSANRLGLGGQQDIEPCRKSRISLS
jgi:hypothetical protein